MWTFEQRVANQIKTLKAQYPHVTFVEIRNDQDLKNLEQKLLENNEKINSIF